MDCFAVSVAEGLVLKEERFKLSYILASSFGFFQGMMFLLGFFLGKGMIRFIENFSNIIGFIVLVAIGIKMIIDSRKEEKICITKSIKYLIILSIATSLDALGVGFGISLMKTNHFINALIIAITTFIISFLGVRIGEKASRFTKKAEVFAGIILIIIGLRILLF